MNRILIKAIPVLLCFICLSSCNRKGVEVKESDLTSNKKQTTEGLPMDVPSDVQPNTQSVVPSDIPSESTQRKPDKPETVQGVEYTLQYLETAKATGVQVHDRDVYIDGNGTEVKYDHLTGQLVGFSTNISYEKPDKPVSEEEVLNIAREYINSHCDLSKYSLDNVVYDEYTGYKINYVRLICGYSTTEGISMSIAADGKIQWFVYNPYVFDGIQIESVDEGDALKELDAEVKTNYGDSLIQYEVQDKRLALGENGDIVLEFFVRIEFYLNAKKALKGEIFAIEIQ